MNHLLATYSLDGGPQDYAKVTQYLLRHGYHPSVRAGDGRIALPQNCVGISIENAGERHPCRVVYDHVADLLRGVPYVVTNLVVVEFSAFVVSDWYREGWGMKESNALAGEGGSASGATSEVAVTSDAPFPWG